MEEIMYQKSYQEYKAELDAELTKTAESFVRIGYLLKVARDTDILAESGYATVTDFAKAEYGIDKTQVSRFIHINDKFAEGGYSDHLMPSFQGYGYAKLTLMLSLPDTVNEGLSPNYSKAEIQSIKDEVDAEGKVTDIELMLEQKEPETQEQSRTGKVIRQLACNEPELFVEIDKCLLDESWTIEDIKERMAPDGECTYSIRIPGEGRYMLMLSGEADARIVNVRTGEADTAGWGEIGQAWMELMDFDVEPEKRWSELFCMPYPVREKEQKAGVAPVQQTAPKKASKVKKAPKKTEWKSAYKPGQQVRVIANDHIGELIEKTDTRGKWEIQFATYTAEMSEAQFTEYVEEPEQETLHAVEPSIPLPEPVEPEQEELEPEQEQTEEDLPGQQDLETDYREAMPENAINPPCGPDQEEGKTQDQEALSPVQEIILKRAQILMENVRQKKWEEAMADVRQLDECIRQAGGCE
ncbi:MAG: hypothetical protein MSA09_03470 [Lachnospiraceae bacterium]|nr:hypothetical protein [Lachnospiraceae bacterium]